jgi:nicotinamidase-related amidase
MAIQIAAEPYAWPFDGTIVPERTALICIDWQTDFCPHARGPQAGPVRLSAEQAVAIEADRRGHR